ncbi:ATP-binding cassette domain-containing protein [Nonomuraea sp. NPDC049421]|uniref:ABC transporter ATP-binding protein/permease n=1 Tax=Nonomuraea sp. NPDC049421 TaxID=3155275 RepID=UPI0034281950
MRRRDGAATGLAAGLAAVTVLAAVCGGAFAPHDPAASIGMPWAPPGAARPLGTDAAGRDVLSRVLAGGRDLTLTALVAAMTAALAGVAGGLVAGWAGGRTGRWLTALADLLLAAPFMLTALVLAVALPAPAAVVAGTVCGGAPLGLRMVRDLVRQTRHTGYVEAARCRGETAVSIVVREILPSVAGLASADVVLRFVMAVQLAAAFGMLGLGPQPPAPDWGSMLRENLPGATLNPAALVAPAAALTVLALASLLLSAALGASPGPRTVPRARRDNPLVPGRHDLSVPAGRDNPSAARAGRTAGGAVLEVAGLTVADGRGRPIVTRGALHAGPGEVVAITGPSGGGKTTLVRAALDILGPGLRRTDGVVTWRGSPVRPGRAARRWRRAHAGLLDQDPAGSLNPLLGVGALAGEDRSRRPADVRAMLTALGLDADRLWHRRPHQLSGGQAQRVALARALLGEPGLLVLDEPTSGLDPAALDLVVQAIGRRRGDGRSVTLVISHDAEFVSRVADRVLTIGAPPTSPPPTTGSAPASAPVGVRHATGLDPDPSIAGAPDTTERAPALSSIALPDIAAPGSALLAARPARGEQPVLQMQGVRLARGGETLLAGAGLTLWPGELVAILGPSGAGKSTLLRALAGLLPPEAGGLWSGGLPLVWPLDRRPRTALRAVQLVGQDPAGALNPAHRVATALARPARVLRRLPRAHAYAEVPRLLRQVGLDPAVAVRRPGELSGGQRQRVALARALAAGPTVLLADEITSALDGVTAARLLGLLERLRAGGLAVLLVTHDREVAARADRVLYLAGHRLSLEAIGTETHTRAP